VARHAVRTNFRQPVTRAGLAAFAAVAALAVLAGDADDIRSVDADLLHTGFLVAALFVLRSGLEDHREGDLGVFLGHNFMSPAEYAAGMALSLLGSFGLLLAFGFLVALAASAGHAVYAAWFFAGNALRIALLLPFILWVEAVSRFRIPLLVPGLVYLALAVVLALTVGEARMVEIVGPAGDPGRPATWIPLAVRAGVILPAGLGAFVAAAWLRGRRRGGTLASP
jgi:hypothetical protein